MTFHQRSPQQSLPHIAIISSGRPGNVAKMQEHLGSLSGIETWYVGPGEEPDYRYAGATNIVEGGALAPNRNLALERAFQVGQVCVQLDDDLQRIDWCVDGETKHQITLQRAIGLLTACLATGAYLAGTAATDNAFFMPKKDGVPVAISDKVLITAAMMAVAPNPIRFDENLRLKEDFGHTIDHIQKYGKVARVNTILARFQYQTNGGGAVQYRTHALEQESIAYLHAKYPGWLTQGRTEDELRLVIPSEISPLRS